MGVALSRLVSYLSDMFEGKPARILMLGLDNAGKTTILYKVKLSEVITTIPTIGFNVESVNLGKGINFTVWDVGGQTKIRALWRHYFSGAEGLLFVIDSSDPERLAEAREELFNILTDDAMSGVPFVVMANKQDLPNAQSAAFLIDKLCLRELTGHQWYVQACCAHNGDGIFESMTQMAGMIKQNRC